MDSFILERVCGARYFNFTNQIDVYSPTIEGFGVGIHASYGDTTHIYNAYLGNDNGVLCNCSDVGIRIAEDMCAALFVSAAPQLPNWPSAGVCARSESAVISPRLDHITTPTIINSSTTVVLFWDSPGDPPSQCVLPPQCSAG